MAEKRVSKAVFLPAGDMINSVVIKQPPIYDTSHWIEVADFTILDPLPWLVLTKATDGISFIDPSYGLYSEQIRQAGMRLGSYHFMEPGDPIAQADHFSEIILTAGFKQSELLACDLEVGGISLSSVKAFLDRAQIRVGIRPLLYSRQLLLESLYPNGVCPYWLKSELLWIAEYPPLPNSYDAIPAWVVPNGVPYSQVVIWQYTENAIIGGIPGNEVDANLISPTYMQAIRLEAPHPPNGGAMPTGTGRVQGSPNTTPAYVRNSPSTGASANGKLQPGTEFTWQGDKVVANGFDWYNTISPIPGWIADTATVIIDPPVQPPPADGVHPIQADITTSDGHIWRATNFTKIQ